jgi:SM-20-related protein
LPKISHLLHDKIIDAIAATGIYVGESILTTDTNEGLRVALLKLHATQDTETALRPARIGENATSAPEWRGDSIAWLPDTPSNNAESAAMLAIKALQLAFNAALFTGIQQTELHYAHYPIGAFYKRHLDRFATSQTSRGAAEPASCRIISLVFYLNADWLQIEGGELVLYEGDNQKPIRVLPKLGTMVAFRSEQFPHEVLPAIRTRLSLTGWMLARTVRGQAQNQLTNAHLPASFSRRDLIRNSL